MISVYAWVSFFLALSLSYALFSSAICCLCLHRSLYFYLSISSFLGKLSLFFFLCLSLLCIYVMSFFSFFLSFLLTLSPRLRITFFPSLPVSMADAAAPDMLVTERIMLQLVFFVFVSLVSHTWLYRSPIRPCLLLIPPSRKSHLDESMWVSASGLSHLFLFLPPPIRCRCTFAVTITPPLYLGSLVSVLVFLIFASLLPFYPTALTNLSLSLFLFSS